LCSQRKATLPLVRERLLSQQLLLLCCLQALSGTGSLRLGAAFIARFMKGTTVYISNPTWGNHRNIFGDEGVEWKYYRWVGRSSGLSGGN